MSNVRQKIPNLLRGVSQQPDNKKFLGQLRESINAYPDWPTGLMKRPGEKYEAELINADTGEDSKWFSIIRDGDEKYVGQFDATDRLFKLWKAGNGDPVTVDMGSNATMAVAGSGSVPTLAYQESQRVLYSTAKAATQAALGALQSAEAVLGKAIDAETVSYEVEFEVDTTYQESVEQLLRSGVLYNQSTDTYTVKYNGSIIGTPGNTLPAGYTLGTNRSEDYQYISTYDYLVYEVLREVAPTNTKPIFVGSISGTTLTVSSVSQGSLYVGMYLTGANVPLGTKIISGSGSTWVLNTSLTIPSVTFEGYSSTRSTAYADYESKLTAYNNAASAEATAKTNWLDAVTPYVGLGGSSYYLTDGDNGTTPVKPDDLEILTLTDYTFILNKTKTVKPLYQTFVGSTAGTTLTVTSVSSGSEVVAGMTLTGATTAFTSGTTILCQLTGTPKGTGTYLISASQTTSSQTITSPLVAPRVDQKYNTYPYLGFVVIAIVSNLAKYQLLITVGSTVYTHTYTTPASSSTTDSELIVSNLVTAINAGTSGVVATTCGTGIYLQSNSPFTLESRGTNAQNGMYTFTDSLGDISKLPVQCVDGYVVKVSNSERVEEDDYYVKFVTNGVSRFGLGTWEETPKPGVQVAFDPLTMPHQLVRKSDGTFIFGPISSSSQYYTAAQIVNADNTWVNRFSGDDETNPFPSFYNRKISGLFFYRDRLGLLSDDNVILSRAGQYFSFFGKSAATVADSDPVDLNVASIEPTVINYVLPVSVGLVLFGERQQFLLSTDADVLTPKSAKINNLSNYECDRTLKAKSFGTTVAFISKSNLYTRVFELLGITVDQPPVIDETTRIVPQLLPSTTDNYIVSPNLALASFTSTDTKLLYHYRYLLQAGDGGAQQRVISAWYKWLMSNNTKHQFFDLSNFYLVGENGGKVYLTKVDLSGVDTSGQIRLESGRTVNGNLDMWIVNPQRTYDYDTEETTVHFHYQHDTSRTLAVIALDEYIGDEQSEATKGMIFYPTIESPYSSFTIPGNWLGKTLIVGYVYQMYLELPKLYPQKGDNAGSSDTELDLILHRFKLGLTMSGPVDYKVNITGINGWSNSQSNSQFGSYDLNTVNVLENTEVNVPIYQRNKNVEFVVDSSTPLPLTIDWLTWEGKVNSRSYRSA